MPSYKLPFSSGELKHTDFEGRVRSFVAYEFDIHAPSEHTIDGEHFALEVHIKHHYKGTDGQLGAGIGILYNVGEKKSNLIESIYSV